MKGSPRHPCAAQEREDEQAAERAEKSGPEGEAAARRFEVDAADGEEDEGTASESDEETMTDGAHSANAMHL